MRRLLLSVSSIFLLATTTILAQQDRALTHFTYDKMSFNPAATGVKPGYCGTLIYRNQWDKFIGAPNSFVFNAEGNFPTFNSGIGISFAHDAIGFQRTNKFYLNYAYHLNLPSIGGVLSFGAGLGMINVGLNPTWVTPSGLSPTTDPSLNVGKTSATTFDMNFGIYYSGKQGKNDYYAGVSVTHLTQLQLKNVFYSNKLHFVVMGGYMINIGDTPWAVEPNVIVQSDFVKTSVNINALVYWMKKLRFGVGYRIPESLALLVGWRQSFGKKSNMAVDIGYSYDITTNSTLATYSKGSHEIMLKFCWIKPPKPVEPTRNPRWL